MILILNCCDISDISKDLCEEQHAPAYNETLSQRVPRDIKPGIKPGIVPGNSMGTETRTVIGTRPGMSAGRVTSNVKTKISNRPLLSGKALKQWMEVKGFNGETTKSQRASIGGLKGPMKEDSESLRGHL